MAQASRLDPEEIRFESYEDASEYLEQHLQDYEGTHWDQQFRNNKLDKAKIDGAVINVVEYEDGWGFETSAEDGNKLDPNSHLSEYLEP